MRLRREQRDRLAIAQSPEDYAARVGRLGQHEHAVRLLGAAEATAELLGWKPPVGIISEYEHTIATARVALGDDAFAAAWASGRAMPLEDAIADVLSG